MSSMNTLAHHFVISTLNSCFDMTEDAESTSPDMTLAEAVVTLYTNYPLYEGALNNGDDEAFERAHSDLHESFRALLYYAAHTSDSGMLIHDVYSIIQSFTDRGRYLEEQSRRRRTKTIVSDLEAST